MRRLFSILKRLLVGLRTLWLVLGVTLLVLLAIEGVCQVLMARSQARNCAERAAAAGFRGAPWALTHVEELSEGKLKVRWEPYVSWRAAPCAGETIHVDERGLRRTIPAASTPATADSKRPVIWLCGSSVAFGWGSRDEHTIASELARVLAEAGHEAEVINYGQCGYVTTQDMLTVLMELRAGGRPAAVVFLHGYNDLVAAVAGGQVGIPLNDANRRREFNVRWPGMLAIETNRSATMWLVKTLLGKLGARREAARAVPATLDMRGPEELAEKVAAMYADNVQLTEQAAAAHDFTAIYYWQPTVFAKKKLVGSEEVAADELPQVKLLQSIVRSQLSSAPQLVQNERFHDIGGYFDDWAEPVFIDPCHISEAGNQELARRISADLKPLLADEKSEP